MINRNALCTDFWNAISVHYEKECYEDALKDACLYLIEMIQEKSDNYDLDGEALIVNVFSEKKPKLLINKNQTKSETDEQKGYGFIVRGLYCAIRNPLSHKRSVKYSKEMTDAILLFINNYILQKLDNTKEFGYVDNWFEFIFLDNDNDSKQYSDKLLENINKKEKINLMSTIVERIQEISEDKYYYLINTLYNSLPPKEKNDIIILLNRNLIKANNDDYLRMFFNHFSPTIWKDLNDLVRARIEDIVLQSIRNGRKVITQFSMYKDVTKDSLLATYVENWVREFNNYREIKATLLKKFKKIDEARFVSKFFYSIVTDKSFLLENSNDIIIGLKDKNYYIKELLVPEYEFGLKPDKELEIFREEYEKVKNLKNPVNIDDDLPFNELPFN